MVLAMHFFVILVVAKASFPNHHDLINYRRNPFSLKQNSFEGKCKIQLVLNSHLVVAR